MNNRSQLLAERRECLVKQAAEQREQLAQAVDQWRAPLAMVDQGIAAIGFIKKHPVVMAGGTAILLKVLRPTRLGKWISSGLFAWQFVRKIRTSFLA